MADAQLRLEDDVKAPVLRSSQDLQQLVSEHHHLDEKIRHLSALSYLTEQQQYEEALLNAMRDVKKRKGLFDERT